MTGLRSQLKQEAKLDKAIGAKMTKQKKMIRLKDLDINISIEQVGDDYIYDEEINNKVITANNSTPAHTQKNIARKLLLLNGTRRVKAIVAIINADIEVEFTNKADEQLYNSIIEQLKEK